MSGALHLFDGRVIEIRDGLLVGRLPTCDVPLDVEGVSRHHARFVVEAGVVEIEDLGSRNGTAVNGKPITRRVVRDGDVVAFGRVEGTIRVQDAAPLALADPAPGEDLLEGVESGPEVIEFVDEIVPASAPPSLARGPRIEPRRQAPKAESRRGGVLAEDIGQIGGVPKALIVLAGVAFAALVGWIAMRLAAG